MLSFKAFIKEEKMKKVQSSWYSITVNADPKKPYGDYVAFDVHKEGSGKWAEWVVSFRTTAKLEKDSIQHKIASFNSVANAKKYAEACAKALQKGDRHLPDVGKFEEHARVTHGFEKLSRWDNLLDAFAEMKAGKSEPGFRF